MEAPGRVEVLHLFPGERAALLDLLAGLSAEEWARPTICAGWTVRDVALHLVGVELGGDLAWHRDGHLDMSFWPADGGPTDRTGVAALLNEFNESWVRAARRLSGRVLIDLLRLGGEQTLAHYRSLDPDVPGVPVAWAGPDSAPNWLHVARVYTERWHHQQHIRDAVDRPGLTEPAWFAPVLDTFARGLPVALTPTDAPPGTGVRLTIAGPAGGAWHVYRDESDWRLVTALPSSPAAEVAIDQDTAWRLFTKGLSPSDAARSATMHGDRRLAWAILHTVSIIA